MSDAGRVPVDDGIYICVCWGARGDGCFFNGKGGRQGVDDGTYDVVDISHVFWGLGTGDDDAASGENEDGDIEDFGVDPGVGIWIIRCRVTGVFQRLTQDGQRQGTGSTENDVDHGNRGRFERRGSFHDGPKDGTHTINHIDKMHDAFGTGHVNGPVAKDLDRGGSGLDGELIVKGTGVGSLGLFALQGQAGKSRVIAIGDKVHNGIHVDNGIELAANGHGGHRAVHGDEGGDMVVCSGKRSKHGFEMASGLKHPGTDGLLRSQRKTKV